MYAEAPTFKHLSSSVKVSCTLEISEKMFWEKFEEMVLSHRIQLHFTYFSLERHPLVKGWCFVVHCVNSSHIITISALDFGCLHSNSNLNSLSTLNQILPYALLLEQKISSIYSSITRGDGHYLQQERKGAAISILHKIQFDI